MRYCGIVGLADGYTIKNLSITGNTLGTFDNALGDTFVLVRDTLVFNTIGCCIAFRVKAFV